MSICNAHCIACVKVENEQSKAAHREEKNFECQFMGLTEKGTQITSTIPFDIKEAVQVCTLCSLNKFRITRIECVTSGR